MAAQEVIVNRTLATLNKVREVRPFIGMIREFGDIKKATMSLTEPNFIITAPAIAGDSSIRLTLVGSMRDTVSYKVDIYEAPPSPEHPVLVGSFNQRSEVFHHSDSPPSMGSLSFVRKLQAYFQSSLEETFLP